MHDITVSIIIPVFNVQYYLPRCLQSLESQSLSNTEVIIIDDGSTDRSLEICHGFAKNNLNWSVTSKINEGQGVARNLGIRKARGEFLIFVDSDDWVDSRLCEEVYTKLKNSGADFASFGFDFIDSNSTIKKVFNNFTVSKLSGKEIFLNSLLDKNILSISWNKMYRRLLLVNGDVFFPPIRSNEDIFFSRAVSAASDSCIFINETLYHAQIRPESTSRNMSLKIYHDTVLLFDIERHKFYFTNPVEKNIFNAHVIKLWTYLIIQGGFRIKDNKEFLHCIDVARGDGFFSLIKSTDITRHLSLKNRILMYLCFFPRLLRLICRISRKMGIQPY